MIKEFTTASINFQKICHLRLNLLSWQPNNTEFAAFHVIEAFNLAIAQGIVRKLTNDYDDQTVVNYIDGYLGTTYQALCPVPNWNPPAADSLPPPPPTTTMTMMTTSSTMDNIAAAFSPLTSSSTLLSTATATTSMSTATPSTSSTVTPANTPTTRPLPAYLSITACAWRLQLTAQHKDICHTCGDESFYHWSCDCAQYICQSCNTATPGHTTPWCPRCDNDFDDSLDHELDWDDGIYDLVNEGNGYGDY
ncbi:unnamed protein product [Cyclocybe aegerita]|uniref:Uncharacterized protein n=1 Tax=Cyclocybe aegerita TaxID=1973307 RepID=A0A8S0VZH9_CYCAE|nr:unnamed protein product [Cyclocybe aegerita]